MASVLFYSDHKLHWTIPLYWDDTLKGIFLTPKIDKTNGFLDLICNRRVLVILAGFGGGVCSEAWD